MQKKNAPNPSLRSFLKAGVVGIGGMTFGMPFGLSLTHVLLMRTIMFQAPIDDGFKKPSRQCGEIVNKQGSHP
jgi:hypothetical protein